MKHSGWKQLSERASESERERQREREREKERERKTDRERDLPCQGRLFVDTDK